MIMAKAEDDNRINFLFPFFFCQ